MSLELPSTPPTKVTDKVTERAIAVTAIGSDLQTQLFDRARASLQQLLAAHNQRSLPIRAVLQPQLDRLTSLNHRLNQGIFQVAVFGRVSRGKSALLNALLGENILPTGPLHGVTRWPRSVRWSPPELAATSQLQLELIDTPGLDEVGGEVRTQMAREVAEQADLILFVIAGELTPTELEALIELSCAWKPMLLVLNKMDLYPDFDQQQLYARLNHPRLQQLLSPAELVAVAAAPAPIQVRVEWPNGQTTYEWEQSPPQIEPLRQKLLALLQREGQLLLAVNTLVQAREVEAAIATQILDLQAAEAEILIWRFVRYKALAVALNPLAVLDLLGGALTDLILIRNLARLYGLSMTRYQAGQLWRKLLLSSGGLLVSQLGSSLALGWSKSMTVLTAGVAGGSTYVGTAIAQAGMAGYGAYIVGQATQTYLAQGCTWGPLGPSTLIQEICNRVEPEMILERMGQELRQKLVAP